MVRDMVTVMDMIMILRTVSGLGGTGSSNHLIQINPLMFLLSN